MLRVCEVCGQGSFQIHNTDWEMHAYGLLMVMTRLCATQLRPLAIETKITTAMRCVYPINKLFQYRHEQQYQRVNRINACNMSQPTHEGQQASMDHENMSGILEIGGSSSSESRRREIEVQIN